MSNAEKIEGSPDHAERGITTSTKTKDLFDATERRNMAFFIAGIMSFKFAFESLGSAISLTAQDRFNKDFALTMTPVLTSCFNFFQCICSIGAAQLLVRFRTNHLLAVSIFTFGILALILIIVDAATGGTFSAVGKWTPWLLFVIYVPMGGCLGVIELLRRVIPRDIVGENPIKLKKMDSIVHICYEVAGTAGAFASTPTIKSLGPIYALMLLPILFTIAAVIWYQIRITSEIDYKTKEQRQNRLQTLTTKRNPFGLFFYSVKRGAQIVFSQRRFIWLIPGYVIPFVFHRFIENVMFPTFAKQVLLDGSLSGILLGGSNFGELCGAFFVLLFTHQIPTPLPWVRVDAIALMTLWIFPFMPITGSSITWALSALPLMMLLSGGWAAGDVSLVAYIQSQLHSVGSEEEGTSPLGCVMAFLYSSYVIIFTIISIPMGRVFDDYKAQGRIRDAFLFVMIFMICIGGIIMFASTFIPKGSFAINPKLNEEDIQDEPEDDGGAPKNIMEAAVGF